MTGPVAPGAASVAILRPVALRIEGGFWGRRRQINRDRSIPHGLRQLRAHGQYDDLRRAARTGTSTGTGTEGAHPSQEHTGRPYTDSDVYKMAEALAWDGDTTSALDEIANLVSQAQTDQGYLNSWFQCTATEHFSDLHLGHEMYCAGHLIQAAIAQARTGTGTGLFPPAIAFADHLVDTFGPTGRVGICGHPIIETALVELYRHTGRRTYLDLAVRMIDLRGYGHLGAGRRGAAYYQDQTPLRDAAELDGHCVRALYLAAGATDVYLETGDTALLAALVTQWTHTNATKTYLTGGVGCRRKTEAFGAPYELPPDQAFSETCAGVATILWSWRLLLATGDGRYADQIERVLFNVIAAGVSRCGELFSYINTLQRHGSAMEHGDKAPYRKPWFGCACCPPNVMRLLASLGHYLATTDPNGIQLHQYASGSVRSASLGLAIRTDYPWSGEIIIDVTAADHQDRTIGLRLPGWCAAWQLRVNGVPAPVGPPVRQYLELRRRWHPGDQIRLSLAMPARFTWPDRRIDAVRGCVAIERGPLVYCVEDADLPAGVHLGDLVVDPDTPPRTLARPHLLGGVITIEALARGHVNGPGPDWPYGDPSPGSADTPVRLTAIPYHAWDNRGRGLMRTWLPTVR